MSIEFEVWPVGAIDRLQRAKQVVLHQGISAEALRAVLVALVEVYEDLGFEEREAIVGMVLTDEQVRPERPSQLAAPTPQIARAPTRRNEDDEDELRYREFANLLPGLAPLKVGHVGAYQRVTSWLSGETTAVPDADRLWLDAMELAYEVMQLERAKARPLYEWILATIPKDVAYVQQRLEQVAGVPETTPRAGVASQATNAVGRPRATGREATSVVVERNVTRLRAGLVGLGYEPSRRNPAVYQHPSRSNRRLVIKPQVVRLEQRDSPSWGRPWQLVKSFRLSNQVDAALARAADFYRSPEGPPDRRPQP